MTSHRTRTTQLPRQPLRPLQPRHEPRPQTSQRLTATPIAPASQASSAVSDIDSGFPPTKNPPPRQPPDRTQRPTTDQPPQSKTLWPGWVLVTTSVPLTALFWIHPAGGLLTLAGFCLWVIARTNETPPRPATSGPAR